MNEILNRYRSEFSRALRNRQYERTPSGVLFPRQGVFLGGVFRTLINGEDEQIDSNVMLLGGLDDIIKVYFDQAAQRTAFFIAPFSNNVTPTDDLTNLTIVSTLGEFIHYTEANRQSWVNDAPAAQSVSNAATPAVFTADGTAGTVWGAWLTTSATKSSTASQLPVAASKFGGSRVLQPGDKLSIQYTFTAADGT